MGVIDCEIQICTDKINRNLEVIIWLNIFVFYETDHYLGSKTAQNAL